MEFNEWLMHKYGDLTEKRIKRIGRAIENIKIATGTPISEGGFHLLCVSKTYAEEGLAESQCILGEMEYFDKAINGDIKARELLEKEFNKEVAA